MWKKTQSISQPHYKAKSKQTTIDQSALSVFRDLLHRLEQAAIQILVEQHVAQLSSRLWQTCNKSLAARLRNKSLQQKRAYRGVSWPVSRAAARTRRASAATAGCREWWARSRRRWECAGWRWRTSDRGTAPGSTGTWPPSSWPETTTDAIRCSTRSSTCQSARSQHQPRAPFVTSNDQQSLLHCTVLLRHRHHFVIWSNAKAQVTTAHANEI